MTFMLFTITFVTTTNSKPRSYPDIFLCPYDTHSTTNMDTNSSFMFTRTAPLSVKEYIESNRILTVSDFTTANPKQKTIMNLWAIQQNWNQSPKTRIWIKPIQIKLNYIYIPKGTTAGNWSERLSCLGDSTKCKTILPIFLYLSSSKPISNWIELKHRNRHNTNNIHCYIQRQLLYVPIPTIIYHNGENKSCEYNHHDITGKLKQVLWEIKRQRCARTPIVHKKKETLHVITFRGMFCEFTALLILFMKWYKSRIFGKKHRQYSKINQWRKEPTKRSTDPSANKIQSLPEHISYTLTQPTYFISSGVNRRRYRNWISVNISAFDADATVAA